MALMSYPNTPAILYKGYCGFLSLDECEAKKIVVENYIADFEIKNGKIVYIETYCMEMEAFKNQVKENKELNGTNFGV